MRRLIINADDFGLTAGVNRGIAECMRGGVVTSTTLMAAAPGFSDALQHLQQMGCLAQLVTASTDFSSVVDPDEPAEFRRSRLSIGCHVVLVDGSPLLPPESVPSLMSGPKPEFRGGFLALAGAVVAGHIRQNEVEAEVESQIRKTLAAGIGLSHLDTHKHVHLLPVVLQAVLQAAATCGIRAIRNPYAPMKPLSFAHLMRRPRLWKRYTEVKVLRARAESFRRTVRERGMVTTDGTFGIVSTGALDLELFEAIIGCIPEGTWELCCHPGCSDGDLDLVRTRLRGSRDREREILTSPAAREILERHGIELISYRDLL